MNSHNFFLIVGCMALASTVGWIVYMLNAWNEIRSVAQRMRFINLLLFVVLATYAAQEQVRTHVKVESRNELAAFVVTFSLVTVIVSVWEKLTKNGDPK